MAKSECAGCGKVFKGEKGFNAHRVGEYEIPVYAPEDTQKKNPIDYLPGNRRCLTTAEMLAKGMTTNAKGWWILSPYDPNAHKSEVDEPEEEFDEDEEIA